MRSKILLGIGIAFFFFFTVGCSKDSKLVCTHTTSGVDIVFNIGFKGNTIEDMDFSYDMDLSNYSDLQISAIEKQDFCSSVKSTMSQYKDAFTDCKQSVDNKHLKVKSTLEVDKIAKNMLQKMSSPKAAKKALEAGGYSCTIK